MELTEEQLLKFKQAIKIRPVCPNCGSTQKVKFDPSVLTLLSLNNDGEQYTLGGSTSCLPLIAGICPDCGHTMLFHLKTLGVI